ncbi:hypothetical protein FACS1894137_07480 [Spirochaetia bacterium]|nr:hypothetical protein FACS1894137_07480 [Spirochaetia bacterium]
MNKIDYETACQTLAGELKKDSITDGCFCTTDWLAIGTMIALLDRGIEIPKQTKLVGFDDISTSAYCRVPLTTIHQDIKGMANLAVEIMLKMLTA